ncbi:hypothetical protein [Moraxella marmotae]|uniref:hypothetical protein n=1 Tax=Moraxella marmotae TaxID=3344520 RepID=UPI0035F29646
MTKGGLYWHLPHQEQSPNKNAHFVQKISKKPPKIIICAKSGENGENGKMTPSKASNIKALAKLNLGKVKGKMGKVGKMNMII